MSRLPRRGTGEAGAKRPRHRRARWHDEDPGKPKTKVASPLAIPISNCDSDRNSQRDNDRNRDSDSDRKRDSDSDSDS
jgi:hypothetical protein